jgi:hypothetical protein
MGISDGGRRSYKSEDWKMHVLTASVKLKLCGWVSFIGKMADFICMDKNENREQNTGITIIFFEKP